MICRTAVEIICRSADIPPSAVERLGLRVHTLFCSPCRRFRGQLFRLHRNCVTAENETPPMPTLSSEARSRIAGALEKLG